MEIKSKCRCLLVDENKENYVRYHDEEWGVPVHDDKKGLIYYIIICISVFKLVHHFKRRDGYRKAFANFDAHLQVYGLINDHSESCYRKHEIDES